jgi:chemotaxis methyl-accepting protein methylase/ActR/RegA family two-component response regulator
MVEILDSQSNENQIYATDHVPSSSGLLVHVEPICELLERRTGHSFVDYKCGTLCRRIRRRLEVLHVDSVEDYIVRLDKDEKECQQLLNELLIGVSQFFRDPEAFASLEINAIPEICGSGNGRSSLRIWVPGCASGEEAYSLAIAIDECLSDMSIRRNCQILATDIDGEALCEARNACYGESSLAYVSDVRLRRYFTADRDGHRVIRPLREMCSFSIQDLVRDPPFASLDFISCRNVLSYLSAKGQDRVLEFFHYALRPRGILFLGASDDLASTARLFEPVDEAQRIFRRKDQDARAAKPEVKRESAEQSWPPQPVLPPAQKPAPPAVQPPVTAADAAVQPPVTAADAAVQPSAAAADAAVQLSVADAGAADVPAPRPRRRHTVPGLGGDVISDLNHLVLILGGSLQRAQASTAAGRNTQAHLDEALAIHKRLRTLARALADFHKDEPSAVTLGKATQQARILVMDDDDSIREMFRVVLSRLGHNVTCVHNGAQAIERYRLAMDMGQPFDVVVLDLIVQGGMGGREALAAILIIDPDAKVVVSSGDSEDPALTRPGGLGFAARLAKPCTLQEIKETIDNVLHPP